MAKIVSIGAVVTGIAAATLLAVHAQSAHAAADQQVMTVKVLFADLNPTSPEDARTLYSRLRDAAREVCGDDRQPRVDFAERTERMTCERDALQTAVAQIDSRALSLLHGNGR